MQKMTIRGDATLPTPDCPKQGICRHENCDQQPRQRHAGQLQRSMRWRGACLRSALVQTKLRKTLPPVDAGRQNFCPRDLA